jgi:hypothetical protein
MIYSITCLFIYMDTVTQMIDVRVHFNIMEERENVAEEIYMVSLYLFYTPFIDRGSGHEFGFGVNSGEGHAESVNYGIVELSIKHDI